MQGEGFEELAPVEVDKSVLNALAKFKKVDLDADEEDELDALVVEKKTRVREKKNKKNVVELTDTGNVAHWASCCLCNSVRRPAAV